LQNVAGQDGWRLARRLCQISRRVEQVFGPSRSQGRRRRPNEQDLRSGAITTSVMT
jgi:hypothetical protein